MAVVLDVPSGGCLFQILVVFLNLAPDLVFSFLDLLFFISLDASSQGSFRCWAPPLLLVKFFSFVFLLCLGYSCLRSWLFDINLIHELALVVFLVINHHGLLGCRWFSPLTLGCEGSIRGYTYVLLISACCKSVLVSKVIHRLAGQ